MIVRPQHAAIADACLCACEQVHRAGALAREQPSRDGMTMTFRLNDDEDNDSSTQLLY